MPQTRPDTGEIGVCCKGAGEIENGSIASLCNDPPEGQTRNDNGNQGGGSSRLQVLLVLEITCRRNSVLSDLTRILVQKLS